MITFSILLAVLLTVAVFIATFGAGLIAVFGDLIVCGLIIGLIVKLFNHKKNKE